MLLIIFALIGAIIYAAFFWPEADKVTERTIDWSQTRMSNLVIYGEKDVQIRLKAEEAKIKLPLLGPVLASSRMVIIEAQCQAGIDYRTNPPKVKYNKERTFVNITVEDVQLLNCRPLGNGVEYVDTGGIFPASTELSNKLFQEAMVDLEAKAANSDLLEKARESAAMELELEARRFGFEEVEIIFEAPPEQ